MADKNVKTELNAENLEGVAGGASVKIVDVEEKTLREDSPLRDGAPRWRDGRDLRSSNKRLPENKDEEPRHDVEF